MPRKNDALANLVAEAETLPEPYLITGPQAAYVYHRWLRPISKMVDVCIPEESKATWQVALRPPWTVFTKTPTLRQACLAIRMVIIEPPLTQKRYARRIIHHGLNFISAEDLCIDLLRNSKTQIGLSEIAALLIKQKETLDWVYLFSETSSSWLGYRLLEIIRMINYEAGQALLKIPGLETQVILPSNVTAILPDTLKDILRPLRRQREMIGVQLA